MLSVSHNSGCSPAIRLERIHISLYCRNTFSRQKGTRSHCVRVPKPARSGLEADRGRTRLKGPLPAREGPQAPFYVPCDPTPPTVIACGCRIPLKPTDPIQEGSRGRFRGRIFFRAQYPKRAAPPDTARLASLTLISARLSRRALGELKSHDPDGSWPGGCEATGCSMQPRLAIRTRKPRPS